MMVRASGLMASGFMVGCCHGGSVARWARLSLRAAGACAPAIFVLFGVVRSLPFVSPATGAARAPPLSGNAQDTLGNAIVFEVRKGLDRRAQTRHGLQAVVIAGLSALGECVGGVCFLDAGGAVISHPTHR